MAGKKGMVRYTKPTVSILIRIEEDTYKDLLKLRIVQKSGDSFNKWIGKILTDHVNRNGVLIKGYNVDMNEFE